jgi:predicted ester cyclase
VEVSAGWARVIDGKVVACWAHVDALGLMRQLGVVEG